MLPSGALVEMVYRPHERESGFIVWEGGTWRAEPTITVDASRHLRPFSPQNNLFRNDVVLLPSEPEEYGSEEALIAEVSAFIDATRGWRVFAEMPSPIQGGSGNEEVLIGARHGV